MLKTLQWTGSALRLLDQTRLPMETVYVEITDEKQMWDAIRRLVVRGAPAIGIAAAFGVYLGVRNSTDSVPVFFNCLDEVCNYLVTSRPTAVNLFWAINRVKQIAVEIRGPASGSSPPCNMVRDCLDAILNECRAMVDEDNRVCRAIGEHGLQLLLAIKDQKSKASPGLSPGIKNPFGLLTHCNAGGLATAEFGTALAPVYLGHERGISFHVYADETRPLLQGSRITAYELQANHIPVTVLCDSMAATVMSQGKIDVVIVGTDRVAANGDVANKIGTLSVAILARHFQIPFYVAAPTSSIDLSLASGDAIPIEQRDPREISNSFGKQTAPADVDIYNPAFDVTPADLVTAIITEHGVYRPPYRLDRLPTAPRL